jgi:hypothetical protein
VAQFLPDTWLTRHRKGGSAAPEYSIFSYIDTSNCTLTGNWTILIQRNKVTKRALPDLRSVNQIVLILYKIIQMSEIVAKMLPEAKHFRLHPA